MNRDFKRYDGYKDSGVEWLGEVPEHWEIKRLKEIVIGNLSYGANESAVDSNTSHPRYIRITDFSEKGTLKNDTYKSLHPNVAKNYILEEGDILFARSGATAGKTFQFKNYLGKACYAGYLIKARPKEKVVMSDYLIYFTKSTVYENWRNFSVIKATIENISAEKYGFFLFCSTPPLHEQKSIADYLDTKTAQIDRKIDLLTQKATQYGKLKQSLINETVTRGLDKTVKMKDSGVEWIGEVPEHWEVKRVKELFEISRGRVIAQTELIDDGLYPVYSSQTKDDGCLGYINTFDYEGTYITWTTDGANAGTVFLRSGKFNCTNICGTLKCSSKNCHIGYLTYALQVSTKHNKRIDTNGAKIMSNEMMFIKITVPPFLEQKAIADYLDTKTAHIDRITEAINTQIDKLKESRKTLINDVVTGKIKVI